MTERVRGQAMAEQRKSHHYFVDEAGDLALFDRAGREIVGSSGCSQFFMLGVVQLYDPAGAGVALEALRQRLLSDPYFRRGSGFAPQR